jgi:hypothetical protein
MYGMPQFEKGTSANRWVVVFQSGATTSPSQAEAACAGWIVPMEDEKTAAMSTNNIALLLSCMLSPV